MVVIVAYKIAQENYLTCTYIMLKCTKGYRKITTVYVSHSRSVRTKGARQGKMLPLLLMISAIHQGKWSVHRVAAM